VITTVSCKRKKGKNDTSCHGVNLKKKKRRTKPQVNPRHSRFFIKLAATPEKKKSHIIVFGFVTTDGLVGQQSVRFDYVV
jgi:hypothetical protein